MRTEVGFPSVNYTVGDGCVGHCGHVAERRTFGRGERGSKLPVAERRTFRSKELEFKTTCCRFRNLGNFVHPPLCPCLSEETLKSLLLCVYARGSKISHTGKCVTCRGLRVVVFISTPLILAPAAGADSRSGRARERRRAGSVDGSNVLAGSPRVYGRM